MSDVPTLITTGLLAYASKDLIKAVLGPTAEYVGQETRGLVQKCNVNLSQVFSAALRKLQRLGTDPTQPVNLRVFQRVINDAKFAEDQLSQEYYGGILAAAKSTDGIDDRGVYYLSLIQALSAYQLRLHYLIYLTVCRHFRGRPSSYLDRIDHRDGMKILIPMSLLLRTMVFPDEASKWSYVIHCLAGLSEKQLIGKQSGAVERKNKDEFSLIGGEGIRTCPTLLGCDVFLWSNGVSTLAGSQIGELMPSQIDELFDVSEIVANRQVNVC